MAKFRVYGVVSVTVWTDVEADDAESAKGKADETWSGLSGYAGNGGMSKLVGVSDTNDGIEPNDDYPEWQEVEER